MNYKYLLFATLILTSCRGVQYLARQAAPGATYAETIDTKSKPITFQTKKIYHTPFGVSATNQFDGARLCDFIAINDSTYRIVSTPENEPINPSPWYAFKIWSDKAREVTLVFDYGDFAHRYFPKTSSDGHHWMAIDSAQIDSIDGKTTARFFLTKDTTWIVAQELYTEAELRSWMNALQAAHPQTVDYGIAGKTKLGRDLYYMDLGEKKAKHKDLIILLSRQHPPEVTGQFALKAFIDGLFDSPALAEAFFKSHNVLVFPMMNPDGVALGHWRHNVGGIDLNRDWAVYNQPETRVITDFINHYTYKNRNRVVLGLDFHSTWSDVYYTNLSDSASVIPNFTKQWIDSIKSGLEGYQPRVAPSALRQPVSKNWFYVHFKAVGITYEIGDDTPRDFIDKKGRWTAKKMMEILME